MHNDEHYMRLALDVAKAGVGQTSPNPAVGAVVVNGGTVVGLGAHLKAGEPHAEVYAIRMAGEKARGATVYVTLEPCSHYGKTPPCADLLIQAGVRRVVVATTDPNPLVAGKGIAKLRQAGIDVDVGVLKDEADELNRMFFHYIAAKTPFVTLKFACSLDGKIATATGESKWITSSAAREDVHRLRAQHDAILVGVNTVLTDNPKLTVRFGEKRKNPLRIILDTKLRTPLDAHVVADKEAETWIITGGVSREQAAAYERLGVRVFSMPTAQTDVRDVLRLLGEQGVMSLFVEGGSRVHDSFLRAGAVNEVIAYIAPKLIGGRGAPTPVGGLGFARLAEAVELDIRRIETIGPDIKIVAAPKRKEESLCSLALLKRSARSNK
ncbi:bifunctional diaminohydroxyphosphoribosylaminopyrimidine deaminase/5-amino-6-(5-phosphoribosylamino)uracil reductase RibD [Geobacillus sp. Y412MC52]|uniref:bifunctional diaminohydroxyphosphoribosylaminopyrimidine deaminase/5-amino-6-(5-phosphoribosylamino)uracil reductase RibD n=1 Tax=Geobacillus sp. (strain Y412MC52) TaxID=550542 RepID=UPI00018C0BAA|nr:bifunctional diaminohydroxyphosphoribosylaminopyrimidine deaminase/5-amino-6-(5-phosphoribosylamino)uracil reductase RibD [Geobacillus sp. Y412MC52]ADU94679.1 riboflavin biosynthesis protein RibD [Geobacillus sp. Y412MC52]ALA71434.1 5-amino-6-(5-phosphoribosylamino)uracil reductase [Geobacillus stearothermophilus 10]